MESEYVPRKKTGINPKDNHSSFQSSAKIIIQKVEEMQIKYVTAQVKESGIKVNQLALP